MTKSRKNNFETAIVAVINVSCSNKDFIRIVCSSANRCNSLFKMIYSKKEQEIIQIQQQSDMQKKDEQKRAEFEEEMEGPNLAHTTS